MKNMADADYIHAKKVCKDIGIKDLKVIISTGVIISYRLIIGV